MYSLRINKSASSGQQCPGVERLTTTPLSERVLVQSDTPVPKESNQGLESQASEQSSNTIMTRDEGQQVSGEIQLPLYSEFASSEPPQSFGGIIDRWVALDPITINTGLASGTMVAQYLLPELLFQKYSDMINVLPFTTFSYSTLEFELKFMVNANKFHCGKVVASYRCDNYMSEAIHRSSRSALTRNHVILDLSSNAEGVLKIPFKFHRAFLRNVTTMDSNRSVRGGYCVLVDVYVLSALRTGVGGPNEMNIRPFLKISDAKFYGMSYRVEFQMDKLYPIAKILAPEPLKSVIRGIEVIHSSVTSNEDKPSDYRHQLMVPNACPSFGWGKGPSTALALKMDPSSSVPTRADDNLTDVLQIAQIWGLKGAFEWSASNKPGKLLYEIIIDPTTKPMVAYLGVPTPLEFICGMYNFWSGPIEIRLDFVSNSFHTGAVTLCAQFGRLSSGQKTPWKSMQSTYTKTFHLGEQKSVTFVLPYIYDTVWRRSNTTPIDPMRADTSDAAGVAVDRKNPPLHSFQNFCASFSVFVVNELTPPPAASQSVEVLVYWRATSSFRVHSLTQSFYEMSSAPVTWGWTPVDVGTRTVDANETQTVHALGRSLWKDLVPYLADGQNGVPTAPVPSSKAHAKRHVVPEESPSEVEEPAERPGTSTSFQAPRLSAECLVEGKEPSLTLTYVHVHTRPGRLGYEAWSNRPQLIRSLSYAEKNHQISMYPLIHIVDIQDPKMDRTVGFIRVADYTPHTQMDSNDPTINFGLGSSALLPQTNDSQTNIKDIMRRPVLLFENKHIPALWTMDNNVGFIMPITTPDYFAAPSSARQSVVAAPTLRFTPQAMLCSLFRYWRGTTRYTIIVHANTAQPVYITYIPHSGVHHFGELHSEAAGPKPNLAGAGTTVAMIIPSVNPTATIEVPFDTENIWCFTNSGQACDSGAFRDRMDINAGHLFFTSPTLAPITVWWSAGDDFVLTNYYGIPNCKAKSHLRSVPEIPKTQNEGWIPITQIGPIDSVKAAARDVSRTIDAFAPRVDATISRVDSVLDSVQNSIPRVEVIADNLDQRVTQTTERIDELTEETKGLVASMRETLMTWANTTLPDMVSTQSYITIVKDALLDITVAAITRSWFPLAIGIIRAFTNIANVSLDSINHYVLELADWIKGVFKPRPQTEAETPRSEGGTSTIVGILAGLTGVLFKVKRDPAKSYNSYFQNVVTSFTDNSTIAYVLNVVRLVKSVFECFIKMVSDGLTYLDPQARALRALCKNDKKIAEFTDRVLRLTSEVNKPMMKSLDYRHEVWLTVVQAQTYLHAVNLSPTTPATRGIIQMVKKMLEFAKENSIGLTSSPVRFEPYLMCIVGPPGVGKSHMIPTLTKTMLESAKYKIPFEQLTYTRSPAAKFWDGYNNQKVIIFDDFLNITCSPYPETHINEIYELKTPNPFTVNQASLAEKGMQATPLIVVLSTNSDFPNVVSNVVSSPEAVFRRRDVMVHADLAPGWTFERLNAAETSELVDYPHLTFRFHNNPRLESAGYEERIYTWADFNIEIQSRFLFYHERKMEALQNRVRDVLSTLSRQTVNISDVTNPYLAFWDLRAGLEFQDGELPSDRIEKAVADLEKLIESRPEIVEPFPSTPAEEAEDTEVRTESAAGLISFLASTSVACILNSNVVNAIQNWLPFVNNKLISVPTNLYPMRKCSQCKITKECPFKCKYSHVTCSTCTTPNMAKCCMGCDGDLRLQITSRFKLFVFWLKLKASKTVQGVAAMLDKIEFIINVPFCYYQVKLLELTHLVACLSVDGAMLRVAGWITGQCISLSLPGSTQTMERQTMNSPKFNKVTDVEVVDYIIPETPRTENEDIVFSPHRVKIFHIGITHDQLCAFNTNRTDQGPCLHQELVENAEYSRYVSGAWIVPGAKVDAYVDLLIHDGPCFDESCPLADYEKTKVFYKAYVAASIVRIQCILRGLRAPEGMASVSLNDLPKILRPAWATELPTVISRSAKWWNHLGDNYSKHKKFFQIALACAGALGALAAAWKIFDVFKPNTTVSPLIQGSNYDPNAAEHMRRNNRSVHVEKWKWPDAQSEDMLNQTGNKLVRNMFAIRIYDAAEHTLCMLGTGIYGHVGLMPKHYISHIHNAHRNGFRITLEPIDSLYHGKNQLRQDYTFNATDFREVETTDLMVFITPKSFAAFKDIRSLFMNDQDLTRQFPPYLRGYLGPTSKRDHIKIQDVKLYNYQKKLEAHADDGTMITSIDVMCYELSEPGICGSFLLNPMSSRPIVCMHTAGLGSGRGYGAIITQSLLAQILPPQLTFQMEDVELEPLSSKSFVIDDFEVALMYHGEIAKGKRPHIPTKSKISKSSIHNKGGFTPDTEPCKLNKSDPGYNHPRTPLYYGVAKHGKLTKNFPKALVDQARDALYEGWFMGMEPIVHKPSRLTVKEAVVGCEFDYYDPMKLFTSAGYPWTYLNSQDTTKQAWITAERDEHQRIVNCEIHPELLNAVKKNTETRLNGHQVMTLFVDTLKDERKKHEKVAQPGHTRVFCACPVDYTICARQNFLHFSAAFMKHRLHNMSAVGINCKGTEWTDVYNRLGQFGGKVIQADYSNFGPAFNAVVAEAAAKIIIDWTMANVSGSNEIEMWALMNECLQSVHVAGGTVYQQFCGSPSGAPMTSVINSLVNLLYIQIAWISLTKDCQPFLLDPTTTFKENVYPLVYGDDLIMAVSDKYIDRFNMCTITKFFAEYRISATTGLDKDGEIKEYVMLNEATFLKRSFRPHPMRADYAVAPLAWSSINDITQWIWRTSNVPGATRLNCELALMEAHAHGIQAFDMFKAKLNKALIKERIQPMTLTWFNIDEKWFRGELLNYETRHADWLQD